MHKNIKNFFMPNEEIRAKNKEQRKVIGEMFSFIVWGFFALSSFCYILFCIVFPPTTKFRGILLGICLLLHLGTLFGISLNRSWPKFLRKFQNKSESDSLLEKDLLFLYFKETSHSYSHNLIQQIKKYHLETNEVMKTNILVEVTKEMDLEVSLTKEKSLNPNQKTTYLKVVGSLLDIIESNNIYTGNSDVQGDIIASYQGEKGIQGERGLSERNLAGIFGEANKVFLAAKRRQDEDRKYEIKKASKLNN
jgi:hypothetical protein